MTLSKFAATTIGFFLILIGAQLYLVKSCLLTTTATRFLADQWTQNGDSQFSASGDPRAANPGSWFAGSGRASAPGQGWPFYRTQNESGIFNASSWNQQVPAQLSASRNPIPEGHQHRLIPPRWITWPALFLGAIFFLHGLALKA